MNAERLQLLKINSNVKAFTFHCGDLWDLRDKREGSRWLMAVCVWTHCLPSVCVSVCQLTWGLGVQKEFFVCVMCNCGEVRGRVANCGCGGWGREWHTYSM